MPHKTLTALPGQSQRMFRVVITGKQNDCTNEAVEAALATLFKATLEQTRVVLSSSRYVVKAGLTEEIASQYQSAIRATGALCLIEDEAKVLNLDADLPKIEKAPATEGIAPQSAQTTSKTSWSTYIWIFVGIFSVVFFGEKLWTWAQTRGESPPTSISGIFASVKAYGAADQIIQSQLTSPGSYKAVRHDLLWSATLGAESAYIVRAEYDAQNGFGAMLRGCQYVSFVITGEKLSYNRRDGQQQCDLDRDNVNWSSEQQKLIPFLIKNFGFDRFTSASDTSTLTQKEKASELPPPAAIKSSFVCGSPDRINARLNELQQNYGDVPPRVDCDSLGSNATSQERLICGNVSLRAAEALDARAYVYAHENATKGEVDHKTFDKGPLVESSEKCVDEQCLCEALKRRTNDSLGGTSPYVTQ